MLLDGLGGEELESLLVGGSLPSLGCREAEEGGGAPTRKKLGLLGELSRKQFVIR